MNQGIATGGLMSAQPGTLDGDTGPFLRSAVQTLQRFRQRCLPPLLVALLCLATSPWLLPATLAHETPAEAKVTAFMRPQGSALQVMIRVPMKAMQDVEWPLRGPGYLVLEGLEPKLQEAATLWILDNLQVFEDGRLLERPQLSRTRISMAADRSFASHDSALRHLAAAPIDPGTELHWAEQWLDVLLEYPIRDPASRFAIEPRFARMGLSVRSSLRFTLVDQPERALEWHGNPGRIELDPRWHQTTLRFVASGVRHILSGIDHLLFVLCLVVPFRHRPRALFALVTAFTLAHSITLAAAALGHAPQGLWFVPLVETLIAASIIWMAIENLFCPSLGLRFASAFGFGLIHGFGFSFGLQEELQFAGSHLVSALLAFNLGVELGQLLVLALALPLLLALARWIDAGRLSLVLALLIAHAAWHWLLERGEDLLKFPMPVIDAAAGASLARWLLALLLGAAALSWVWGRLGRWIASDRH
jgi:hypothetical protein